tara:strand:- start:1711 stop:1971 length:261 start_codon:yes stop_codon:yes gene_type:complete
MEEFKVGDWVKRIVSGYGEDTPRWKTGYVFQIKGLKIYEVHETTNNYHSKTSIRHCLPHEIPGYIEPIIDKDLSFLVKVLEELDIK